MTAPERSDPEFLSWLARWAEVSAQCWARPGTCCSRSGCRVELLGGPSAAESDSALADPVPGLVTPDDRTEALSARRGRQDATRKTTTDHERPRRAAA